MVKDILAMYMREVKTQMSESEYQLFLTGDTDLVSADFDSDEQVFQFRFHTKFKKNRFPVAQYVTVDFSGSMNFRKIDRWFVPAGTDFLFRSFANAVDFTKVISH